MVEGVDPSDRIDVGEALSDNAATGLAEPVAITSTAVDAVNPPEIAVTVIVRKLGSPPVLRVAVTVPVASVVVRFTSNAPELADNVIGTFANRLWLLSSAIAVIVALVVPFCKMADALELTAIELAVIGPVTVICVLAVKLPEVAVTVIELPPASLGTVNVSINVPLAPVLAAAGIDRTPALVATVTGTLATATLLESSATTVIATVSPGSTVVGFALILKEAAFAESTTATCTCALKLPTVAVTVIVRNDGSPAVDRTAVAEPDGPVVVEFADTGATPPEDALNATGMLDIKFPLVSFTNAVSFAVVEPSDSMARVSETKLTAATVDGLAAGITCTSTVLVRLPEVAVTVMEPAELPIAVSVA